MNTLSQNWITEGLIDFEYKKYMLLGYLQHVKTNFDSKRLYPDLSDLLFHFNNLVQIKENKTLLQEHFPKQLSTADFEQLTLLYDELVKDDALMCELENIISFALPQLQAGLSVGKEIYDSIEDQVTLSPVGLSPLHSEYGYLLIYRNHPKETHVYDYHMSIIEHHQEQYRSVRTQYLETYTHSLSNTFEGIKYQLLKKYKNNSNPATFLIYPKVDYPFQETLLPIAKRMLMRHIGR